MAEKFIEKTSEIVYIGGLNLRLHRQRVGLSQAELAELLTKETGVEFCQQKISKLEGSHTFQFEAAFLPALLKILKIS